jgi:hypothetical protein
LPEVLNIHVVYPPIFTMSFHNSNPSNTSNDKQAEATNRFDFDRDTVDSMATLFRRATTSAPEQFINSPHDLPPLAGGPDQDRIDVRNLLHGFSDLLCAIASSPELNTAAEPQTRYPACESPDKVRGMNFYTSATNIPGPPNLSRRRQGREWPEDCRRIPSKKRLRFVTIEDSAGCTINIPSEQDISDYISRYYRKTEKEFLQNYGFRF